MHTRILPYKVRLTRIKSNHDNLRTSEIVGECGALPTIGLCFTIWNRIPLTEDADFRYVVTTPVRTMTRCGDQMEFTTANSKYQLDVLPEGK
jgi:hypothetical protein